MGKLDHVVQIRVVHVVQILKCKHWLVPERRLSVNAFWWRKCAPTT